MTNNNIMIKTFPASLHHPNYAHNQCPDQFVIPDENKKGWQKKENVNERKTRKEN